MPGIIGPMTERGLPLVDGAPACPFVAFEDDRDERAPSPDHRHRCYAEIRPAPRALAHQEAYCLSSAFPVCPTFQDWARREAARARSGEAPVEEAPQRNPPREWSAPPPWTGEGEEDEADERAAFAAGGIGGAAVVGAAAGVASAADAGDDADADGGAPDFLAGRSAASAGLAGSAADRVAAGEAVGDAWRAETGDPVPDEPVHRPVERSPAERRSAEEYWASTPERVDGFEDFEPEEGRASLPPPAAPAPRPPPRGMIDRRPRVGETRRRPPVDMSGPSWEQPRRYEAYPTLRTRMGLPSIPRVALAAVALGIAAIALFSLPTILGLGRTSDGGGGATSSPSTGPASAGTSVGPSTQPAATAQVYVVKSGDNLGKIAKKFKTTIDSILKANPQIKDPNKIKVGDQITIPTKGSSGGGQASATAAP
jgi:nucleoid-associated protein YgaU